MSWEGLNRRKFPRVYFPCLIKMMLNQDPLSLLLTHTENISHGGVCVILRKGLDRFAEVDVEIDLMDGEDIISCRGKTVWVVRRKATDPVKPSFYDTGIEFMNIAEHDGDRIRKVVDHLAMSEQKVRL